MNEIEILKQDLGSLCTDMDSFCDIYREDPDVWQGEAATEEACYITADIGGFRETAKDIKKELDTLAKMTRGEERK